MRFARLGKPPRVARSGNRIERRLRFDNEVVNVGTGPLEVYPVSADCDRDGDVRNDRLAMQRIFVDDGDGVFNRARDTQSHSQPTDCMIFHPQHRHWHIENFARYELKRSSDGTIVASSAKVSFCIIDIHHRRPALPGSPATKHYTQCDRASTLGISVGWSDEYHSTLADQYIVLPPGVGDGTYCLLSTVDPSGYFVELNADKLNNVAGVQISISGGLVVNRNPTLRCR